MKYGIDVSSWQGKIDWSKVKKAGIEFAIIRAGFGKATMDQYFEANYAGAKAAGIPVGAYFYSYAKSAAEGEKEAQVFLSWLKGKQFEYPVCLDQESSKLDGVGKKELTEAADAFLSTVQNAGYYVCLYSNPNWLRNRIDGEYIRKKYDIWLAQYPTSRQPDTDKSSECSIWQYSEKGKVSGITGNVCLDVSYKDYAEIIKSRGFNGFNKEDDSMDITYKVKSGDTLSGIAKQYNTTVQAILQINPQITNANLIRVGQEIRIPGPAAKPVDENAALIKEIDALKDEITGLKDKLKAAEERAKKAETKAADAEKYVQLFKLFNKLLSEA